MDGHPVRPQGARLLPDQARPRRRRVVMQRKVSEKEYEQHKERMEGFGLDPSDPVPSTLPASSSADPGGGASTGAAPARATIGASGSLTLASGCPKDAAGGRQIGGRRDVRKQVSLQKRTIEEQIISEANDRALANWARQQEQWEKFNEQAAARTGRSRAELVVTRAEEHRERKEVMELLERATPEEVLSGGYSWYHSLRGEGTRFVTVGNMFSGISLPIRLHKEAYDREIVRKPLLRDVVSTHRALREMKKGPRTWRDDEYLLARMRRYWKQMQEHAPGKLEFDELLEPEVISLKPATSAASAAPALAREQLVEGAEDVGVGRAAHEDERKLSGDGSAVGLTPIAEENWPGASVETPPQEAPLQDGPHVQVLPNTLQFHADVKKKITQSVRLKNTGTAVITFDWVINAAQHGYQESVLPDEPTDRFTCHTARGQVLPGQEIRTLFTFTSSVPGIFTSSWRLVTYPELLEPINEVMMHGVVVQGDLQLEQRREFKARMLKEQVLHQVEELIEDIVETVKLQPQPPPDLGSPLVQERVFEEVNESLGLYWSGHAWERFADIGERVRAALQEASAAEAPGGGGGGGGGAGGDGRPSSLAAAAAAPPGGPQACVCGNIFAPDAAFCRKCGARRPEVAFRRASAARTHVPIQEDLGGGGGGGGSGLGRGRVRGRRPIPKKAAAAPAGGSWAQGVLTPVKQISNDLHAVVALQSSDTGTERRELIVELDREIRAAKVRPPERSPLWWPAYEAVLEAAMAIPDALNAARKAAELQPLPFLAPPDEYASPTAASEHSERQENRLSARGDDEKEEEVRNGFVEAFASNQFGSAIAKYASVAHEVTMVTSMHPAATLSMRERFQPYMTRMSIESVELSGMLVLIEVDLGLLAATISTAAPGEDGAEPSPPRLSVPADIEEQVRQRLSGVVALTESTPLAIFVMAHLGEPAPDAFNQGRRRPSKKAELDPSPAQPPPPRRGSKGTSAPAPEPAAGEGSPDAAPGNEQDLSAYEEYELRMRSLPSLEPLADVLREATEGVASSVEFVPHRTWVQDAEAFAERARGDAAENKVFLLENMAAFPEELGVHRIAEGIEGNLTVKRLPWATREAWASRVFKHLRPDMLILDSLPAACETLTSHSGLWVAAPQRIVGPSVEGELHAFLDALRLPFSGAGSAPDGATAPGPPQSPAAADPSAGAAPFDTASDDAAAPMLAVVGGGGFGRPNGEQTLLQKLKFVVGLAHLAPHEKDGLNIALGGELAVCVLSCILGIQMGVPSFPATPSAISTVREALGRVLALGVTLLLPTDVVCERVGAPDGSADHAAVTGEETAESPEQTFSLNAAFAAAAQRPISLGYVDGSECFLCVNPEQGTVKLSTSPATVPSPAVDTSPRPGVPEGWSVRDIGEQSVESFRIALLHSRGVLWNGSLGVWEDERWHRGTRTFLAAVERRLAGGGDEDEEDDVGDVDADEQDEDEDERDEDIDTKEKSREELDTEVDFEVAVVLGRDSTRMLPSLMENPSLVSFTSQSGDALVQLLRGHPLPGLLACAEKSVGS